MSSFNRFIKRKIEDCLKKHKVINKDPYIGYIWHANNNKYNRY